MLNNFKPNECAQIKYRYSKAQGSMEENKTGITKPRINPDLLVVVQGSLLKPDNVIVREMKKYKLQRTKTFIQISRNKTIISPRNCQRKQFPRKSMDLLR